MFIIVIVKRIIYKLKVFYTLNYIYPKSSTHKKIRSVLPESIKKIGSDVSIEDNVEFSPCFEEIGNGAYLGKGLYIGYCKKIGSFTSISYDVKIGLVSHPLDNISTSPLFYAHRRGWVKNDTYDEFKSGFTEIGSDVLISANVVILAGVKIGHGAVIGAGAVVNQDIPPYAIAVGVPAKVIKYRFSSEIIESLLKSKWWEKDINILKSKVDYAKDPLAYLTSIGDKSI